MLENVRSRIYLVADPARPNTRAEFSATIRLSNTVILHLNDGTIETNDLGHYIVSYPVSTWKGPAWNFAGEGQAIFDAWLLAKYFALLHQNNVG